jgi:hypothetical protein
VHNSPRKKQDSQNLSISSSDINFMNIPFNRKFGFFFSQFGRLQIVISWMWICSLFYFIFILSHWLFSIMLFQLQLSLYRGANYQG